jgi:hypothetical protein
MLLPDARPPVVLDNSNTHSYNHASRQEARGTAAQKGKAMAPSATPMLTSDTSQLEVIQTVCFGVDGNAYEIDLPARQASELRSMVGRYISAARRMQPRSIPPGAPDEPAVKEGITETGPDVCGGEHGLTDGEKQELRIIADSAKPQRGIVAGRLRTKGLADRDSAGNWWLTGAGRRELMSA